MDSEVSAEVVRRQVNRILSSPQFCRAEQLSRFLTFAVEGVLEGRAGEVKETILGIEVFGRGAGFDPRIDPIVRVTARKLRSKLAEYYATEGSSDPLIVELPTGGYVPVFRVAVAEPAQAPPASSIQGRRWGLVLMAILLAVCGLGFALLPTGRMPSAKEQRFLTRLTDDVGVALQPALSSTGQLFAFASDRSGRGDLDVYLQPLSGREAIRLSDDAADDYEPAFSPDGSRIAFTSDREGGGIYSMPVLGGPARLVVRGGRRPQFSPDGSMIAFEVSRGRVHPFNPESGKIFVIPAEGGTPRQICPKFSSAHHPIWLPRRQILFLGVPEVPASDGPGYLQSQNLMDWWVVDVDSGATVKTGFAEALKSAGNRDLPAWETLEGLRPGAWLDDGVVFEATNKDSANLWKQPLASGSWHVKGEPEQLTFGTGKSYAPSAKSAGTIVAFSEERVNDEIYSLPIDADSGKVTGSLERLTRSADFDGWPSLSSDGRTLVFLSERLNHPDIWRKDLLTGEEVPLTNDNVRKKFPEVSPDGREVSYYLNLPKLTAMRMTIDGRPLGTLCEDCAYMSSFANGSRILYYDRRRGLIARETKTAAETVLLRCEGAEILTVAVSPDARWLTFTTMQWPDRSRVFVTPFQTETDLPESKWIPVTDSTDRAFTPLWSPDGSRIYYQSERDGHHCLWAQHLDANKRPVGEPVAILHLHQATTRLGNTGQKFRGMSLAKDKIVFPVSETRSSVWVSRPR